MLEIISTKLILRDMHEKDVEDYLHWYTLDKEWMEWDAPWEASDDIDPEAVRQFYYKRAMTPPSEQRHRFQIENSQGIHLGWVTSYMLEDNKPAIGIDIPSQQQRRMGYGTLAYTLFLRYFLSYGQQEIFTQTWSGNAAMMALAERVGFVEVERKQNQRLVRGQAYDGITYKLVVDQFYQSQGKNPLWVLSDEWDAEAIWVKDLCQNTIVAVLNPDLSWGIHQDAPWQGIEERIFKIAMKRAPELTWQEFCKRDTVNINS